MHNKATWYMVSIWMSTIHLGSRKWTVGCRGRRKGWRNQKTLVSLWYKKRKSKIGREKECVCVCMCVSVGGADWFNQMRNGGKAGWRRNPRESSSTCTGKTRRLSQLCYSSHPLFYPSLLLSAPIDAEVYHYSAFQGSTSVTMNLYRNRKLARRMHEAAENTSGFKPAVSDKHSLTHPLLMISIVRMTRLLTSGCYQTHTHSAIIVNLLRTGK